MRNPTWIFLTMLKERLTQGWTQGPRARDGAGRTCSPLAETAVAWCLQGGCERVIREWSGAFLFEGELWLLTGEAQCHAAHAAMNVLARHTWTAPQGCGSLVLFNEYPGRTQAEVLALVDQALADVPREFVESEFLTALTGTGV